jgi:hypothetical protein
MFTLPLAGGAMVQPRLGPLGNGVVAVPLLAIEPLAPPEALPLPEPPLVLPLVGAPPEAPPEELPEAAPEATPELPTPLVAPEDTLPLAPEAVPPLVDPEAVWLPVLEPALEVPEPETFTFEPPFDVPQATSPMATRARYPNQRIFAEPSVLFFASRLRQRGIAPAGTSAVKARHAMHRRCPARLDSCTEDGKTRGIYRSSGHSGEVGRALLASALVAPALLQQSVSRLLLSIVLLSSMSCASRSRPPDSAAAASESSSRSHTARNFGWVGVGLGAEAAVGAVATSVIMLHDKSVRDSNCNAQKVCAPAGIDANQDIGLLSGWNVGAWVLAAAGLGIGGYLVWKDSNDGEQRTAITVSPIGPGAGLGVRSSF